MNNDLSTQTKGTIAELRIICTLLNKGCNVFRTCSENCRYDLIFEYDNILYKVQVKSAKYDHDRGIINIRTTSNRRNIIDNYLINESRSYKGEIDYLGIYCSELDKCYLISEDCIPETISRISLRVDPTKNNQALNLKWARDYEI